MAATTPTRFDGAMFASAQAAGERSHRSAAQQLAHWARLGQELEASGVLSQRDIDRVLAGQVSYDQVTDLVQAAVRTAWREQLDDDITTLDLAGEFEAQGRTRVSESDEDGRVVVHTVEGGRPLRLTSERRKTRSPRDVAAG